MKDLQQVLKERNDRTRTKAKNGKKLRSWEKRSLMLEEKKQNKKAYENKSVEETMIEFNYFY